MFVIVVRLRFLLPRPVDAMSTNQWGSRFEGQVVRANHLCENWELRD